jgi:hypothetical protein
LMLSILPNPAAWAWGYRSVVPLLKATADGSGPYRTTVPGQPLNLLFERFQRYRNPLAAEIHGALAQRFTGVSMQLGVAEEQFGFRPGIGGSMSRRRAAMRNAGRAFGAELLDDR